MERIKLFWRLFLSEPLWFKILIVLTLLIAVVFSSSSFNGYYQSLAKLAAALFFGIYSVKFRSNKPIFVMFMVLAIVCLYLAGSTFVSVV
ncbi:hypothetical protein [Paenibacillus dakarensis]|uniref:hypothetical protein n=1 Tax=Paenibacillus dakarensis TaxID=1527293 RepID=UPI0006D5A4D5|nr:hypothetical protein [Paenibacillus dakarensis]